MEIVGKIKKRSKYISSTEGYEPRGLPPHLTKEDFIEDDKRPYYRYCEYLPILYGPLKLLPTKEVVDQKGFRTGQKYISSDRGVIRAHCVDTKDNVYKLSTSQMWRLLHRIQYSADSSPIGLQYVHTSCGWFVGYWTYVLQGKDYLITPVEDKDIEKIIWN